MLPRLPVVDIQPLLLPPKRLIQEPKRDAVKIEEASAVATSISPPIISRASMDVSSLRLLFCIIKREPAGVA